MTYRVSLSICGDVERPACLASAELGSLMDAELVGLSLPRGLARTRRALARSTAPNAARVGRAADAAGYVTIGSGDYTAVLPRAGRG
jgi:hypothetical protein